MDSEVDSRVVVDVLGVEILGLDVLGVDVMGVDVLAVDVLGVDILGVDVLGVEHSKELPKAIYSWHKDCRKGMDLAMQP